RMPPFYRDSSRSERLTARGLPPPGARRYRRAMERRDDDGNPGPVRPGNLASRCDQPAGASPASVSAGAPSSRPAASGETQRLRQGDESARGSDELRSVEQVRGPQHQVKLAASTDEQSGGRAGHVTAKATAASQVPERGVAPGGVWRAARVQGG